MYVNITLVYTVVVVDEFPHERQTQKPNYVQYAKWKNVKMSLPRYVGMYIHTYMDVCKYVLYSFCIYFNAELV